MTNKTKWHSGPPPSCGWWPASACRDHGLFRWWNGKYWSWGVDECSTAFTVQQHSQKRAEVRGIKWTERPASWPERSKT